MTKVKIKINDRFFSTVDLEFRKQNWFIKCIFYEILECIKIELNFIFKKNFNKIFFEIIIGAWLRKFIQQFLIKYQNINEIIKTFNIQFATIYDVKNFNFYTSETHTIQHATINNLWNSCIYSYILSKLNLNIDIEALKPPSNSFEDKAFLINGKIIKKKKI